jgi:NAD(P)-dependent dehydrogenase (short-subunit alcohol dehydrogenase family)
VTARPRVALVTGASSGIGAATARTFAGAGYRVAVGYARDREAAAAVAAETGGRAFGADVADPVAVATMVEAVEAELGPIAVAVCNAGFYEERPLAAVDDALFDRTLRVLLGGCFHVARAVVPRMRLRGDGAIVTVASELALIGGSDISHYVAAKAAVLGFTRALAREVAPTLRVNAVAPGAVDTPLLPDRDRGPAYTETVPLRRIGRPEEVAAVILALAESGWCTGATWTINGGVVIQ